MAHRIDLPQFGSQPQHPSPSVHRSKDQRAGQGTADGHDFKRLPSLPRTKRPVLSSHRHDANPAMALKVLQDIQTAVNSWHQELRQVVGQIQDLYLEGPIVEGWLEAVPEGTGTAENSEASVLRHADPQDLEGYVDQHWGQPQAGTHSGEPAPRYNLCRLDADGRLQCQLCPVDQLAHITRAVARHQRLRQHLSQKHYLESRLKRAVEVLTRVRGELDIPPSPEGP
ncbi:hypothetical protein C7271_03570 [filamentous cyanobacterium CCP5]|nr:hypothetical protein C7271_03570 [filamentous cyanobacterium CCP5]